MVKHTAYSFSKNEQYFHQSQDDLTKYCDKTNGTSNTKKIISSFLFKYSKINSH